MIIDNFLKLLKIFNSAGVDKSKRIIIISCGLAGLESVGIASLVPLLSTLSDPNAIMNDTYLSVVFNFLNDFGINERSEFIIFLCIVTGFLLTLSAVYKIFTVYHLNNFIEIFREKVSACLITKYLEMPYEYFLDAKSSILLKNAISEVDLLTAGVVRPLVNMFAAGFTLLLLVFILFVMDPFAACFTAIIFVSLYILVSKFFKNRLINESVNKERSNAMRYSIATQALAGIKYIKFSKLENIYASEFIKAAKIFSEAQKKYASYTECPKYVIEPLVFLSVLIALSLEILFNKDWELRLLTYAPTIGLFFFSAYRMQPALQKIYVGINSVRYAAKSIELVAMDLEARNSSSRDPKQILNHKNREPNLYSLRSIRFSYPHTDNMALDDINLHIKRGVFTAIVGRSGSGKTTLVDLILGLLKPMKGSITLNLTSEDINSYQNENLISYVPQDVFIFDQPISENIALGNSENIDLSRVDSCLSAVGLGEFIKTDIDSKYPLVGEKGTKLSGGQRQRIGIARALYKQPKILILDEATSALDAINEKLLLNTLRSYETELTILFISHRKSSVLACDEIIYMRNGQVIDTGDFQELRNKYDEFEQMFS